MNTTRKNALWAKLALLSGMHKDMQGVESIVVKHLLDKRVLRSWNISDYEWHVKGRTIKPLSDPARCGIPADVAYCIGALDYRSSKEYNWPNSHVPVYVAFINGKPWLVAREGNEVLVKHQAFIAKRVLCGINTFKWY